MHLSGPQMARQRLIGDGTGEADNGSVITGFVFQWRVSGESGWSAEIETTFATYNLSGLTAGLQYEARVFSVNAQGRSVASQVGSFTTRAEAPGGGPTLALRATPGNAAVALNWLEPSSGGSAITSYQVEWRTSTQAYASSRRMTFTTTNGTISNLTNDTNYFFRVRAVNAVGGGAYSNEVSATPVEPEPDATVPAVAVAPAARGGNAEVTWTAVPPNDGGAQITAYQWRFRGITSPASSWTEVSTGTSTTLRRTGLVNGRQYEAQVRATNSEGQQSTWSPSGRATPQADVPGRPAAPSLRSSGSNLRITWTAPSNGGSAITGYDVQLDDNSSFASPTTLTSSTTSLTATSGISASGVTYVRVRADNVRGSGPWSPAAQTAIPSVAAAPNGSSGGSGIAIWSAADPNDNGARINRYFWRYRRVSTSTWTETQTTTSTLRVSGLQNTAYEAQVRMGNSVGTQTTWSPSGQATPVATVPGRVSTPTLRSSGSGLAVSWSAPSTGGSAILDYRLEWDDNIGFSSPQSVTVTGTSRTLTSNLALTGSTYVRVRARNQRGSGDYSNIAFTTVPEQADAPAGQSGGNGIAVWTVTPPNDGAARIDRYFWRYRRVGTSDWVLRETTGLTLTISGLQNSAHEAQVRARNSVGTQTTWSPSGRATPMASVPGRISSISLTNTQSSIQGRWGAPEDGGSTITGYTVQYSTNSDLSSPTTVNTTSRIVTVLNLTTGTRYYFRVRATNAVGSGEYSPIANIVRQPPANVPGQVPAAPQGNVVSDCINWTWRTPSDGGSQITSFDIQWRIRGRSWSGNIVSRTTASWLQRGLTPGTTYEARVRAVNAIGDGPWSDVGSAVPLNAQRSFSTAGSSTYNFEWDTNRATVAITGGEGGDGSEGQDGGDGGSSSVRYGTTTQTATGGDGGDAIPAAGSEARSEGFALNLANDNPTGIAVTSNRIYVLDNTDDRVYVYNLSGTRQMSEEFDLGFSNAGIFGISVTSNRFYIVTGSGDRVYVYNLSGTRQMSEEFDLASPNAQPRGISVTSTRVYVVDEQDDRVYVYNLSGTRQMSEEFDLGIASIATGIAVASNRIYVVDTNSDSVFVYNLSGTRQRSEEFDLGSGNEAPRGIAVTSNRIYVVDIDDNQVYVYYLGTPAATAANRGEAGQTRSVTLTGLAQNTAMSITVGAGGTGMPAGDAGSVVLTPIF